MIDRQLLEAVDACRPGSDDLHLPEFSAAAERIEHDPAARAFYERVQSFDGGLVAAVHDVPVPEGLAARLLAAIARHEAPCEPVAALPPEAPAVRGRQAWLRWALAASVLVAVGVGGVFALRAHPEVRLNEEQMANQAADWHLQAMSTAAWDNRSAFPADLAPSPCVPTPRRFADVGRLVGQPAAIYDLSFPGQPPATLLVIEMTATALPGAPPSTPRMATANLSVGCWQADGRVFALVVQGDARRYQQFLRGTQNGLAMGASSVVLSSEIAWRF